MGGTYTVTISTFQCGVVGSYSTVLAVKQKPVVTSAFNDSPLCAGDTLQISVNGTEYSAVVQLLPGLGQTATHQVENQL
jgi:hypothetical protein